MTHSTSEFGEEYDSLADLVSFGVAPAVLAYSWGLADFHRLGWMASFLFVVCGSMRLARFNIQTHVVDKRYFVGLPIPAAAGVGRDDRARHARAPRLARVDGRAARPDVRPVVPDDLDDPVPLVQGPRPEAPAAGLDPAGDRALLRRRRPSAGDRAGRRSLSSSSSRAPSASSSGSSAARNRPASAFRGAGVPPGRGTGVRRTGGSIQSLATSGPAADARVDPVAAAAGRQSAPHDDARGRDGLPRSDERLEEPHARRRGPASPDRPAAS